MNLLKYSSKYYEITKLSLNVSITTRIIADPILNLICCIARWAQECVANQKCLWFYAQWSLEVLPRIRICKIHWIGNGWRELESIHAVQLPARHWLDGKVSKHINLFNKQYHLDGLLWKFMHKVRARFVVHVF